jgi:hypothetical protein
MAPQQEVTVQCHSCRAMLTLPLPDAYLNANTGALVHQRDVAEAGLDLLRDSMHALPCPSCHERRLRIVIPRADID